MDIGDDLNLHHNDIDNVCLKSKTGYESAHEREIWYDQSYNLPAFFDGEKKVILADNAKKENNLPVAPTNPETYFLNANKEWSEIQIGNGGFAANLYFTTKDSDVTGYKKIEYTAEATETELSGTLTNQEALFRTYLFDSPIKTTIIDAGAWIGTFRVKVSGAEGVTQLKFEAFVRHVDNTETVLFSYYSTEINNTNYLTIKNESHQPSYVVHATDRLGVKIYGKTTHPAPITIYTIIGDGNASYFTTPLRIRHNQLRDLNGDDNYLHVTSTEKSTWNAKQDALSADVDYLTPTTASTTYEPKKGENDNYVTDDEKTVIENTSGENTGDETAESIIDKIGTDGQIKSDYLPSYVDDVIEGYYFGAAFYSDSAHTELITAEQGKIYVDIPTNFSYRYSGSAYINISNPLDYSTNIETDKASTTKISAIKTFYDWAVGKFIDLAKIVTTWTATPLDTNIPSEKLVKDSLDLKADISPANGATSALRALFIARGATYNGNGTYTVGELTDVTEAQIAVAFCVSPVYKVLNAIYGWYLREMRFIFPLKNGSASQAMIYTGAFWGSAIEYFPADLGNLFTNVSYMFNQCIYLKIVKYLDLTANTLATTNCFNNCVLLEDCYVHGIKVNVSFGSSSLLSIASLQYLITNRANETTRITITVHATVWAKLTDAVNYPTWNALLVDAVNNQCIDFASA